MRKEKIRECKYSNINSVSKNRQPGNFYPAMKGMSANKIKPGFFQKLKAFFNSKISPQQQNYVKEIKANINNIIPQTRPLKAVSQKKALKRFLSDEKFSKKVEVKNIKDGSTEIFQRAFDPVSHEMRINADCFDMKGKLHHTTVYDNNGLKLSQYFVKVNNPKDPILIRRKDFNVNGKITREEIKYKNGDITYVDYDYYYNTQTFKNVAADGSYNIVKNSKYVSETWDFDKNGKQINYKLIDNTLESPVKD